MRDPLALIPVRYKLPLTFVFFCLVAFGLGGYVVTATARNSLSTQIQLRLSERATSLNMVVEKSLELLGRRVEDFASDGYIRMHLERLTDAGPGGGGAETAIVRRDLVHHLQVNKLPLVDAFVDARLLDSSGGPVLAAHVSGAPVHESFDRDGLWVGPLSDSDSHFSYPTFVLSTPVFDIQSGERLGYLQVVVRADTWAGTLEKALTFPGVTGFTALLSSPGGHSLPLVSAVDVKDESGDAGPPLRFASVIERTGWRLDLAVDEGVISTPVDALLWKFLYLGLALVALTLSLLLFPQQFLLKPLSALQDAARRIADGDFSARVEYRSRDEVGELAGAFNTMATVVEERTRKLEQNAETLERREADIRFERDRLNTVIRSMDDGLFILDADGRITLSNVAARPVIEAMSKAGSSKTGAACAKPGGALESCLHCIADFERNVDGCVVTVGSRVFEINGAVLSGPREAIAGKVFVSRDVTARVRQSERQAHQERLSVLGEIAAVMAHELNNPLAAISMFSQMLQKGLDTGSALHSHADVIHRNTESCKTTIRSLLDMATTPASEFDEFDIQQLVADVAQLLTPVAQRAGVELNVGVRAADRRAFGDELQLRQAVVNLVMNSVQALESERDARVVIDTADRGNEVALIVHDNGPGVPAGVREQIFEPFFTTKSPGDGTGLGLPTSRRIAHAQGGRLSLTTSAPGRTIFEIVVPRRAVARAEPLRVVGMEDRR